MFNTTMQHFGSLHHLIIDSTVRCLSEKCFESIYQGKRPCLLKNTCSVCVCKNGFTRVSSNMVYINALRRLTSHLALVTACSAFQTEDWILYERISTSYFKQHCDLSSNSKHLLLHPLPEFFTKLANKLLNHNKRPFALALHSAVLSVTLW